jgi:hypothetical protein
LVISGKGKTSLPHISVLHPCVCQVALLIDLIYIHILCEIMMSVRARSMLVVLLLVDKLRNLDIHSIALDRAVASLASFMIVRFFDVGLSASRSTWF